MLYAQLSTCGREASMVCNYIIRLNRNKNMFSVSSLLEAAYLFILFCFLEESQTKTSLKAQTVYYKKLLAAVLKKKGGKRDPLSLKKKLKTGR